MLSIFLLPAGLCITLGQMVQAPKHGWAVLATMVVLWFAGTFTAYWAESHGNPLLHNVDAKVSQLQSGGNMEGKEVRFGIANSALFATVTTDASCGAVNSMHDSFTPLGGLVPLTNILLGEVVFGGVGAGLYGMLVFVVMAVFIAGLMVGRTPEYLARRSNPSTCRWQCSTSSSFRYSSLDFCNCRVDAELRPKQLGQPWTSRPKRDPVCVYLGHRQPMALHSQG